MRTDAELLRAARTDAHSFRELYDRHAQRVYGFHLRRTGDADAAHDLTAETFAQAWLVRRRFKDRAGGSAVPWLFGIARNVLLLSVRRRRLERSACERLALRERLDSEPATAVPDESWLEGLDEALADLPDGQRDAVFLRVAADLDYEAAATILGTSAPSVRIRVHRGLASLRNRLANGRETST